MRHFIANCLTIWLAVTVCGFCAYVVWDTAHDLMVYGMARHY